MRMYRVLALLISAAAMVPATVTAAGAQGAAPSPDDCALMRLLSPSPPGCDAALQSPPAAVLAQQAALYAPQPVIAQGGLAPQSMPVVQSAPLTAPVAAAPAELLVAAAPGTLSEAQRLDNIFFVSGAAVDPASEERLRELAVVLLQPRFLATCIALVGHSDRSGRETVNRYISERRAKAVAAILARDLGGPERITLIEGRGSEQPLAGFPPGEVTNRRVTLFLGSCTGMQ